MRGSLSSPALAPALVAGALLASFATAQAEASALTLTTGERVNGVLESVSEGRLMIRTPRFGVTPVDVSTVAAFENSGSVMLELTSGERVVATRFTADGEAFHAATRFGEMVGTWSDIATAVENDPPGLQSPMASAPDAVTPSRNEGSVAVSYLSNQTTTLAGSQRTQLTSLQVGDTRSLSSTLSVSVDVPLFYSVGRLTDLGETRTDTKFGLGDVTLSVSRVFPARGSGPHLRARAAVGLPTGSTGGPDDRSLAGFSSGNWSLGGELSVQQSLAGGALLASTGYARYLPRRGGRSTSEFEWALGYQIDLSREWSLTSVVSRSISRRAGERVEPAYVTVSATHLTRSGLTIGPYFVNGLNADAQDFVVGLSVLRSW